MITNTNIRLCIKMKTFLLFLYNIFLEESRENDVHERLFVLTIILERHANGCFVHAVGESLQTLHNYDSHVME